MCPFPWAPEGPPPEWLTLLLSFLLVLRFKDLPCLPSWGASAAQVVSVEWGKFTMQAGVCPFVLCRGAGRRRQREAGAPSACGTAAQAFCPAGSSCLLDLLSPTGGPECLPSMLPCHMVCRKGLISERRKGYLHLFFCVFFFCALKSSLCCQCFVSLM